MQAIFDHIEATQEREFLLRVAYMEVRALMSGNTVSSSWLDGPSTLKYMSAHGGCTPLAKDQLER